MIRRKTWHGIAVLAILACLSWLGARDTREPRPAPLDDLDTRLNYALWDFQAQLLNDQGKVNLVIHAPILRNNASTQIGTVENPRLQIQLDEDDWYITADSAIITSDREFVSLVGNVDLLRQKKTGSELMEIRTRDVMLNVTPRTASTEAEVNISQGGDHLEAVGMKLDLKSDSYELLSDVRGHYAKP